MKHDPIRFSIGPWNGRYSSVWRIWSDQGSDDIYLGVRTLLKYMKISLHKSGKFRAAFTDTYNQKMIEDGKNTEIDRAFLKWDKKPLEEKEIMQVIDIHFPLPALSLNHKPKSTKKKNCLIIQPDKTSLGSNDTVTVKILFHKLEPESKKFLTALEDKNMMPAFWFGLSVGEYVTIAFQYTKKLPLKIKKEDENKFAVMFHEYFKKSGKKVGDTVEGLTIQTFGMGLPPEVFNIGQVSVRWEAEKHFSIDISK